MREPLKVVYQGYEYDRITPAHAGTTDIIKLLTLDI